MALVLLPGGEQRSGSIGSTVYSRNRFGQYIRARAIPVNPNTTRQATIRAYMSYLTEYWQSSLTQAQRDAWDVYGLNVNMSTQPWSYKYLTGFQQFNRSNIPRLQAALAQVDDGPVVFNKAYTETSLSATASEATQQLTVAFNDQGGWVGTDETGLLIQVGKPVNGGIKFFGGPFRYADVVKGDGAAAPTSPATITSPWPIAEGQRLWIQARITLEDGRLSDFARYDFLCAA